MRSILFVCFLNLFHFLPGCNGAINDTHYLIVIPRVFRAGTTHNIGINIFGRIPCDVGLRLFDPINRGVIRQAWGHFQPNEAGMLELQVPEGLYKPRVLATVCGKTTEKTVGYEALSKKIFIQTDKPIYKPGQKVLIRIIFVNSQLHADGKKVSSVTVQEPSGAKMMQWKDVELQDGIASLDLQLSKEPVLGKWLIKATIEGKTVTKNIEIDKYTLPKFQLDVEPPSYLALDQREIPVSICARYTYGKLVTGRLEITLCLTKNGRSRKKRISCLKEIKNVTGCLEVNARELIEHRRNNFNFHLQIHATFTETSTGIKLKETARSPNVVRRSKTMTFVDVPQNFKPGLPIAFKIKTTYLDGKPVTDGAIRIRVVGRNFGKPQRQKLLWKTYSVKNGLIAVVVKNVPLSTKVIYFNAYYNSGYLTIRKQSKAWYSPSSSYLKLVVPDNVPAKVGRQGSVNVLLTVHPEMVGKQITFHHKILCKGNLIASGVIEKTLDRIIRTGSRNIRQKGTVHKSMFNFNVTQAMVPNCRILVYYVKMDKEVVGDSITFDVEDKLENQVSIDFVEKVKKPGEKTKIIIKAKPGSRVAISALDQSVLLLKDAEELTKTEAMKVLNRQDIGPILVHRYRRRRLCRRMGWRRRMPFTALDVWQTFNDKA